MPEDYRPVYHQNSRVGTGFWAHFWDFFSLVSRSYSRQIRRLPFKPLFYFALGCGCAMAMFAVRFYRIIVVTLSPKRSPLSAHPKRPLQEKPISVHDKGHETQPGASFHGEATGSGHPRGTATGRRQSSGRIAAGVTAVIGRGAEQHRKHRRQPWVTLLARHIVLYFGQYISNH